MNTYTLNFEVVEENRRLWDRMINEQNNYNKDRSNRDLFEKYNESHSEWQKHSIDNAHDILAKKV